MKAVEGGDVHKDAALSVDKRNYGQLSETM